MSANQTAYSRVSRRWALVTLSVVVAGIGVACGTTSSDSDGSSTVADSGIQVDSTASTTASDSSVKVGTDAAGCSPYDAATTPLIVCDGGTIATAPSGAACDPARIIGAIDPKGSSLPICSALPNGAYCDALTFSLTKEVDAAAAPTLFACRDTQCGEKRCELPLTDAGDGPFQHGVLEDVSLEAACAATRAFPGVDIRCFIVGP